MSTVMSPDKKPVRRIGEGEMEYLHRRIDWLTTRLEVVNENLVKLASAKLLQQAFTGIVLGGFFTVLVHAIGG